MGGRPGRVLGGGAGAQRARLADVGRRPGTAAAARPMREIRRTGTGSDVTAQRRDDAAKATSGHAVEEEVDGVIDEHQLIADRLRYLRVRLITRYITAVKPEFHESSSDTPDLLVTFSDILALCYDDATRKNCCRGI